ncbi:YecA family protein [Aquabacterium sp.]|uniref:YecA/YgfB family protein n=1 Tax=Aquabacterium sp. TaxID=1872578 RepID=UPI002C249B31|nr:YecA family protein [Aquabacterium sp.]HSW07576.1 YecA family protein [Aquabacterium sp.]
MTPPPQAPLPVEHDLDALQALLDGLPPGHEPLDVVMLDGYLCGVLLQPRPVPEAQWLAHITDIDGKPAPPGFPRDTLRALVQRRHAELNRAIERRDWFDPWVYQLDADASPSETVLPWVAGFATAMDVFPALMDRHEAAILEPLATLYRHFDPDDLEDADELLAEIETLEMPETLAEAVEDLVRSVLLMADVSRPKPAAAQRRGPPPKHRRPPPRR